MPTLAPLLVRPMMLAVAGAVFFSSQLAFASAPGSPDEEWLANGLAAQFPKYERITLRSHPARRGLVAANCERQIQWGGELRVFHRTGDRVDWIAALPDEYTKNFAGFVLSCEWRYLPQLRRWALEVFDSTHRGNGDLWLFTPEGRELRLLLRTKAAGEVWNLQPPRRAGPWPIPIGGEARIAGDHLQATYPATGRSNNQAAVLSGTIVVRDQDDRRVARVPFTQRWVWSASEVRFRRLP